MILSVDIGIANMGVSVIDPVSLKIEYTENIKCKSKLLEDRLLFIFQRLSEIITLSKIEQIVYEQPVMNGYTGAKLHMAVAMLLLASRVKNLNVAHYSPSSVKLKVAGTGIADKQMVEDGVRKFFKLDESYVFHSDHESDAVAIAQCFILDKIKDEKNKMGVA